MSQRYWNFAVALGIAVFAGALWFSIDRVLIYKHGQADDRITASEYYAEATQHGPTSCRSIVGETGVFDWLTCLADNVSIDGGVKQSEYDLKAQQDMAMWAFGMLIVTIWLALITLVGVYFVWKTLSATREMANETTRIGEAQTRGYLALGERIDSGSKTEGGKLFERITLIFRNSGNTPIVVRFFDAQVTCGENGVTFGPQTELTEIAGGQPISVAFVAKEAVPVTTSADWCAAQLKISASGKDVFGVSYTSSFWVDLGVRFQKEGDNPPRGQFRAHGIREHERKRDD